MLDMLWLTLGGLVLLLAGAEGLVRGSSALALRLGMRPLLIGMTVVAFGTSMPEFIVSLQAGLSGQVGIALGNIIGSNICNIGLILGLSAVIRPLSVHSQTVRMDVPVMIGSVLFFSSLLLFSTITWVTGIILLALMAGFIGYSIVLAGKDRIKIKSTELGAGDIRPMPVSRMILFVLAGLAGLILGARLLVSGAIGLSRIWGISETIIGLTVVAVGTSLPELATSVIAALHKESDIAVGNVIGSNIFNTLAIPGLTSLFTTLRFTEIPWLSLGVMTGLSVLCLPFLKSGFRLNRYEGIFLIMVYAAYLWILFY